MSLKSIRQSVLILGFLGVSLTLLFHYMVFFWVSTEATLGISQRIFYIHVAGMWTGMLAFIVVAICSAMYLWLRDERLDRAAVSAAEGGMVFATIMLATGPLWGKIAWGTYWTWEPRLTLTLLLWFIFLGYFLVRSSTENPEKGKRHAAVVAIVGALDIPFIHLSVIWFRSLHPEPVVIKAEGPTLPGDMLATLLMSLGAFTALFLGLFLLRYSLENLRAELDTRSRHASV